MVERLFRSVSGSEHNPSFALRGREFSEVSLMVLTSQTPRRTRNPEGLPKAEPNANQWIDWRCSQGAEGSQKLPHHRTYAFSRCLLGSIKHQGRVTLTAGVAACRPVLNSTPLVTLRSIATPYAPMPHFIETTCRATWQKERRL